MTCQCLFFGREENGCLLFGRRDLPPILSTFGHIGSAVLVVCGGHRHAEDSGEDCGPRGKCGGSGLLWQEGVLNGPGRLRPTVIAQRCASTCWGGRPAPPAAGGAPASASKLASVYAVAIARVLCLLWTVPFDRCAIAGNVSRRDRGDAEWPLAASRLRNAGVAAGDGGGRWRHFSLPPAAAQARTSREIAPPSTPRAAGAAAARPRAHPPYDTVRASVSSGSFLARHPPPRRRRPSGVARFAHHFIMKASVRSGFSRLYGLTCAPANGPGPGAVTVVIAAGWPDVTAGALTSAAAGPDSGGRPRQPAIAAACIGLTLPRCLYAGPAGASGGLGRLFTFSVHSASCTTGRATTLPRRAHRRPQDDQGPRPHRVLRTCSCACLQHARARLPHAPAAR